MPLINSATKKAFSANVSELVGANQGRKKKRSMGQILAIAYSEKRKAGGSG
jgi:hypothetical protein